MDDVVGSDDSLVAGGEDDAAGDEIDQIDVDEVLGWGVLALAKNEAQVRVDVFEQNGSGKSRKEVGYKNFLSSPSYPLSFALPFCA